jgi:predicted porin
MQKKLMAVAVGSALCAPAVALAQSSTVQVYGTMYVEYAMIDQGTFAAGERVDVDMLQTPGSNIGFKGEEKLGGGLSAWFQCESTADPRGDSKDGWCTRNSALGMKGGFGNVFIGIWDSPFKRTASPPNIGGADTGVFGTAQLLFAGSTTLVGNQSRANFKRRLQESINYDSPNFAGFQVMAAYTATNQSTATTSGATDSKPRVLSLGAQYSAGPLYVSAGYEQHREFAGQALIGPVTPGGVPGDDKGWHVGAAYTWGPVRFGGQYTRQKFENGAFNSRVSAWHVGVDWRVVGPHGLKASYTKAGDMKGTAGAPAVPSSQGQTRPGVPAAGAPNDTGAHMWQVRYVYTFSKRTEFQFGYVKLDNDGGGGAAGGTYAIFGVGAGLPGNNQDAWALGLRHTF